MLTAKVLSVGDIPEDHLEAYKALASWRYEKYFSTEADTTYTFIGLEDDGRPQGLCVIYLTSWGQISDIKHLSIVPTVPYNEAAKLLIDMAIQITQGRGFPFISIMYKMTAGNQDLDAYLDQDGWAIPKIWKQGYLFDYQTFNPRWLRSGIPIPEEATIVRWDELTPRLIDSLKETVKGNGVSDYMTPFHMQEYRQKINTLILIHEGRVMGWAATHTFPDTPDTINYTSLFIHPRLRFHGYAIRMLADSIILHIDAKVKYGLFEVGLQESSKSWKRFIERHLKPHSIEVISSVRRNKFLKQQVVV